MITENESSIITSAVNAHGILFKKAVRQQLEQIQGVRIIGEEYPVKFQDGAQLDLLVQYKSKNQVYLTIIECKRAYATFKKWIFFECNEETTKLPYFFEGSDLRVSDGTSFTKNGVPLCIEGIEIDLLKYKKPDDAHRIGSIDRIWQTANQVCRGYHNFLASELNSRTQNTQSLPMDNFTLFPLIITTAQLFICLTKDQNADLPTGNSIGDLPLQKVPYLVLNHAFTPSTENGRQYLKINLPGYHSPIDRGRHAKEGVVILHAESIVDFFKSLH